MKKLIKPLLIALLVCSICIIVIEIPLISISECTVLSFDELSKYFGFNKSEFTIIAEEDTHGGFHGDGSYYLILDCSEKKEEVEVIINDWKPLPLSENLQLMMYGGEKDGMYYHSNIAEDAHWPIINNGVYKFIDRHSGVVDQSDDTDLLNRYSYNFSIAVYDLDTNTLYYYELDT
ncbi:MAG: hypothetical protein IKM20_02575 [Erysipelotrichales bacterium]|nr:hypothetical protein [Erysipelotrichales bacterium]